MAECSNIFQQCQCSPRIKPCLNSEAAIAPAIIHDTKLQPPLTPFLRNIPFLHLIHPYTPKRMERTIWPLHSYHVYLQSLES